MTGPQPAKAPSRVVLDGRYARMRPRTIGVRANYRF